VEKLVSRTSAHPKALTHSNSNLKIRYVDAEHGSS